MPICGNSHACREDYNCKSFPDKKECPFKAPGYPQDKQARPPTMPENKAPDVIWICTEGKHAGNDKEYYPEQYDDSLSVYISPAASDSALKAVGLMRVCNLCDGRREIPVFIEINGDKYLHHYDPCECIAVISGD